MYHTAVNEHGPQHTRDLLIPTIAKPRGVIFSYVLTGRREFGKERKYRSLTTLIFTTRLHVEEHEKLQPLGIGVAYSAKLRGGKTVGKEVSYMKARAKTMAVLLLSGLFAASCAATSPRVFLEQEEELTVDDAFRDRAGPGTSTVDLLDQEYGEALKGGGRRIQD